MVTCVTSVASTATDIVPTTSVTELEETSKQNDNLVENVNTELRELTPTVCELERREHEENMTPEVPKNSQPLPSPCESHAVATYITS